MSERNLNHRMSEETEQFLEREGAARRRREAIGLAGASIKQIEPDWIGECSNCGASPIVPATGMCGPCTFGEADTANGNW